MNLQLAVASLHLLALGIGLGAVWARGRALRGPLDDAALGRALYADNWWGAAAVLWLATGVPRMLALEKGMAYYGHNTAFILKMSLFGLIWLLELWPMITLIGWRVRRGKGQPIETRHARTLGAISYVEAALVCAMVAAAVAMARGVGSP